MPENIQNSLREYKGTKYQKINNYLWKNNGKLNKELEKSNKELYDDNSNLFTIFTIFTTDSFAYITGKDFYVYRSFNMGNINDETVENYITNMKKTEINNSINFYAFMSTTKDKDANIINGKSNVAQILIPNGTKFICPTSANPETAFEMEILLHPGKLTKIKQNFDEKEDNLGTWKYEFFKFNI